MLCHLCIAPKCPHFRCGILPVYGKKCFYLEVLFDCLETSVIVACHGIIVVDALFLEVDDSKTPVHAQVNRNKNEIVGEKINFFGPAFQ